MASGNTSVRKKGVTLGLSLAALAGLGTVSMGPTQAAIMHAKKPFAGQTLTIEGFTPSTSSDPTAYAKYYDAVEAAFTKATGATLKPVVEPPTEETSGEQIQQLQVSHSGDDVYTIGSTIGATVFYSGVFVRLTKADWNEIGGLKQFYPNTFADAGRKGLYSYIPQYNVPNAMVYNKRLFKEAGISKAPTTWTQYVRDAEKVNDPSKGIYGTAMDPADATDPWKTLWFWVKAYGGAYVSPNDKTALISRPPVQSAVQFWFDWYDKFHIVDPASLTWDSAQMEAAFAQGKVGEEVVQKGYDIPVYKSGPVGNDFAFAPMPCIPYGMSSLPKGGTCPGTYLAADGFAISKYGNVPLALQLMKIILSTKFQVMYYELAGGIPATQAAGQVVEKRQPAIVGPFIKALGNMEPTPFVAAWDTVEAAMAGVASKAAAQVASTGSLSSSFLQGTLQSANEAVQVHL